jgi:hypothetical protein
MGVSGVNVNLYVDEYTNRVLGVIKEKYGLKDKSQALIYFAKTHGKEYVDPIVKDEFIKDNLKVSKEYIKKYGLKQQSVKDLRAELERD